MGSYDLTDAITHAWRTLHDEGEEAAEQLLTDTEYEAFLTEAAARYSGERPRTLVEDVTADGTVDLALPAGFVEGFSRLVRIETPAGTPIEYGRAWTERGPSGMAIRWADRYQPASGDVVRLAYTSPRTWEATPGATTIPDADFYAVVALGASIAAEAIAAKYSATSEPIINSDVTNYRTKAQEWHAVARKLRERYADHLASTVATTEDTLLGATSGFLSWPTRTASGRRYLFHDR